MTWRRRQCLNCGSIMTTKEKVDLSGSLVVKDENGSLEPFYEDKLFVSLHDSLSHKKAPLADARALSNTVISKVLGQSNDGLINKEQIIESCYQTLSRFDKAAATYYRAHHSV